MSAKDKFGWWAIGFASGAVVSLLINYIMLKIYGIL